MDKKQEELLEHFKICKIWENQSSISIEQEWLKWLSYEPAFEPEQIAYIKSKKVEDVTHEDVDYLKERKTDKMLAEAFREYFNWMQGKPNAYNSEKRNQVHACLDKSLTDFMTKKLTKEELKQARAELNQSQSMSLENIETKVKDYEKNYDNLSMVDSFIFHILSKYYYEQEYVSAIIKLRQDFEAKYPLGVGIPPMSEAEQIESSVFRL